MSSPSRFHGVLFAASLLLSLASGIVNYALIFYVSDLFGADKKDIGFISAGLSAAYLAGVLLFMRWQRPHPRFVLIFASWAMAACVAVYLVFPSWAITFAFHCLFGLAMSLFWPRIMAWLSWGVEGKDLGRVMGRFNLSWSAGGILAPYLGGLLVEAQFRLPFVVVIALLFAVGIAIVLGSKIFPEMRLFKSSEAIDDQAADTGNRGPTPLRHPARLGVAAAYFLSGTLLFIFPAWAKQSLGFSESLSGSMLLVRFVVVSVGFSIWGRASWWQFKFAPVPVAMAAMAGVTALFLVATQVWQFYVLFASIGLVFSFLYSYALFHGVAGSTNRERSTTLHEAFLNVGLLAGTALGGVVAQAWSMAAALGLAAGLTLLLMVVQVVQNALHSGRRNAGARAAN